MWPSYEESLGHCDEFAVTGQSIGDRIVLLELAAGVEQAGANLFQHQAVGLHGTRTVSLIHVVECRAIRPGVIGNVQDVSGYHVAAVLENATLRVIGTWDRTARRSPAPGRSAAKAAGSSAVRNAKYRRSGRYSVLLLLAAVAVVLNVYHQDVAVGQRSVARLIVPYAKTFGPAVQEFGPL